MTVELKNGETYRGMLTEAEDSMNCQMKEGASCEHLYVKSLDSSIRFDLSRGFLHFYFPYCLQPCLA